LPLDYGMISFTFVGSGVNVMITIWAILLIFCEKWHFSLKLMLCIFFCPNS
jgi:hypothetical protein